MRFQPLPLYTFLAFVGIGVTAWLWGRASRRGTIHDRRLTIIYFAGLAGALLGAKIAFLLAEGPAYAGNWSALLTGRSITGGLLGGYVAVEYAKHRLGYIAATGDVFAVLVPVSLVLGRVGCLDAGCCPGVPWAPSWWTVVDGEGVSRWPAAAVELLFNGGFLAWAILAARRNWQRGNRFHVYLISYGLFRVAHEFVRDDHRWVGPLGGYHVLAATMIVIGLCRFGERRRSIRSGGTTTLGFTAPQHAGNPQSKGVSGD